MQLVVKNELVVLVNGLGCHSKYSLAPRRVLIASGYDVLIYDNRGIGHTTPYASKRNVTLEVFADDLYGLLDMLNIRDRVVLCGHSMGGMICSEFCLKYPDRVKALVISQSPMYCDQALKLILQSFADFYNLVLNDRKCLDAFMKMTCGFMTSNYIIEEIGEEFALEMCMQAGAGKPVPPEGYVMQTNALQSWNFEASLERCGSKFKDESVSFPKTLIIVGEEDMLISQRLSKEFRRVFS